MFAIMDVIKGIRMNEWTLFGRKSRSGRKYSLLQVFQLLLVCPCFMIRNPFNIYSSPLGGKLGCRKDVFYEFLNDGRTDWRKLMYHIVSQLWTKVIIRSDHTSEDTCLMIDDTDCSRQTSRWDSSRHTGFIPDAGLRRSSSRRVRDCSALASASLPTLLRRLQTRPSWHSSTTFSLP